jgi:SAM-dependent methyltransferase
MLNRRKLLGASAALASLVGASSSRKAQAKSARTGTWDVQPRGQVGRTERLPNLDLESRQDFLTGFRSFTNNDLNRAAGRRAGQILKAHGIDARADLPIEKLRELFEPDPAIGTAVRGRRIAQDGMHYNLVELFHANADTYLAEMEATDNAGPGTLELNPEMFIPEYARHEIHTQPGGYVGDDLAGHIYHYGTKSFYTGRNDQDGVQMGFAKSLKPPPDGRVLRILDMGTGIGQMAVAMKELFPEAEVWGVDVAAPMIRYGHMRAVDLGVEINFAQRLAEDTKFPDDYFDIVTSYIMHHELPADITRQVIREAHRITRPGGVFSPFDFGGAARRNPSAFGKFRSWVDHRWNAEVWRMEYGALDFPAEIASVGFDVDTGKSVRRGFGAITGVKPA